MIQDIDHAAISVPDLRAAIDFYCETLGFVLESEAGWSKGSSTIDQLVGLADSASKVAMVRLGGSRLEIFQYEAPEPRLQDEAFRVCDHGFTHICLSVVGIEGEYARLTKAGVVFNAEPVDVGGSVCLYGHDPFGNAFELRERKLTADG
ncbi:MAG: glyoxalase [Deltaproteobacteria bacterium]|jgi:catechol 2,3-dioxygenase-like lactoylglutathione lyase family enzyme|nr:glyoxalase [Deltaproteobacteria bacterium]